MGDVQVTGLGHAGLRIDAPGFGLVMDPWRSPDGAFLGSWFQLPDNSHLPDRTWLDVDWVTVSHEHLDHMDGSVLGRLAPNVRIVIPRYPSTTFRDRLKVLGVKHVIELDAWQRLALDDRGSWVTVIPEKSPMCHDSAFLVVAEGRSVLHLNDARLTAAQGRRAAEEAGGQLDVVAVQMANASWHPLCYEYPSELIRTISRDKRLSKFKAVSRFVRAVKPRWVLPYAGPPCFLDPDLQHHNAHIPEPGLFPDQSQAVAWLTAAAPRQQVGHLMPGDSLDLGSLHTSADPHWDGFSYDDLGAYLEAYAARRAPQIAAVRARYPDPGPGLGDAFAEHFARLGELNDWFLRRIDMVARFHVAGASGGTWDVHLGPDRVRVDLRGRASQVQYGFRVDGRWLAPVLAGDLGWEDLLLSLRFSAYRDPDRYNDYLVGLLKHGNAPALEAVQRYEADRRDDETVIVRDGDRAWQVPRYCPHAGEDLLDGAVVKDGVLRCLGHNFEFDLSSGACLNATCAPLRVQPAVPAEMLT